MTIFVCDHNRDMFNQVLAVTLRFHVKQLPSQLTFSGPNIIELILWCWVTFEKVKCVTLHIALYLPVFEFSTHLPTRFL